MASLTAQRFPLLFHVDYDVDFREVAVALPIFVEPFVNINASWLRMESGEGISMEASTGGVASVLTAQRTGPLTFRVIVPST